jgi:hypothetical protein
MTDERADQVTPSPYNASLLAELSEIFESYGRATTSLEDIQSSASNREWLFENDRSGVADAVRALIAELEHIQYVVPDEDERVEARRVLDAFVQRFLPRSCGEPEAATSAVRPRPGGGQAHPKQP